MGDPIEQLFVRWANIHLGDGAMGIRTLNDFDDGTKLVALLKTLFPECNQRAPSTVPSFSSSPSASASAGAASATGPIPLPTAAATAVPHPHDLHRRASSASSSGSIPTAARFVALETVQSALTMATCAGVVFKFISAEDFCDHNQKMMQAFIYAVVLRFNLRGIAQQSAQQSPTQPQGSEQDALLAWVNSRTAKEPYCVKVADFGPAWSDGRAFLALLHSADGKAFQWESVASASAASNLELAFHTATHILGLQPLLVASDVDPKRPNTQGIVTYVSEICRRITLRASGAGRQLPVPHQQSQQSQQPKVSEAEFQRLKDELVATKKRVGELESELEFTRTQVRNRGFDFDDEDGGDSKKRSPTSTAEDATLQKIAETHTNEHRKVQKIREQLRRAVERVEELAEAAKEDKDTMESLPEEMGWLLDVITQKDAEVASATAVMAQLEMQLTASGAESNPLTENEKVEVNQLLQEAAEEECRVLTGVEKALAGILNEFRGKPIADDVERLRKLAAAGATRANRTLSCASAPAGQHVPLFDSQRVPGSAGREISRTLPAQPSSPVPSPRSSPRKMSLPGGQVAPFAAPSASPAPSQPAKATVSIGGAAAPGSPTPSSAAAEEIVSIPVVVEQLGELEQKLADPEYGAQRSKISVIKQRAKDGWRKAKAKLGEVMHITKRAERRDEDSKKQQQQQRPSLRTSQQGGTAAVSQESGNRMRAAIRQAILVLNPQAPAAPATEDDAALLARFDTEVRKAKETIERKAAEIVNLQATLVEAQTKVWDRVKQIKKK